MTRAEWRALTRTAGDSWPWVPVRYRGKLAAARACMARGMGRNAAPALVRDDGGPAALVDARDLEAAPGGAVWACGDCDAVVAELAREPLLLCPWCGAPRTGPR